MFVCFDTGGRGDALISNSNSKLYRANTVKFVSVFRRLKFEIRFGIADNPSRHQFSEILWSRR